MEEDWEENISFLEVDNKEIFMLSNKLKIFLEKISICMENINYINCLIKSQM